MCRLHQEVHHPCPKLIGVITPVAVDLPVWTRDGMTALFAQPPHRGVRLWKSMVRANVDDCCNLAGRRRRAYYAVRILERGCDLYSRLDRYPIVRPKQALVSSVQVEDDVVTGLLDAGVLEKAVYLRQELSDLVSDVPLVRPAAHNGKCARRGFPYLDVVPHRPLRSRVL
jgi:hypothetical protein